MAILHRYRPRLLSPNISPQSSQRPQRPGDFGTLWKQRGFLRALCAPTAVGTSGSTATFGLKVAAGFTLAALLCVASAVVAATFLDAVLAGVAGSTIVASDVAAARGLSLFGARPSDAPIRKGDAERLVDGRLIDLEAAQLAIGGNPQEAEEAWQAAAERVGGMAALHAWMDRSLLDEARVRRLVEADLRWRQFVDLRFRAFVFISEAEVTAALGSETHSQEVREGTRERLRAEATDRDLAEWLAEARKRVSVRYAALGEGGIPLPFPMPPLAGQTQKDPARRP